MRIVVCVKPVKIGLVDLMYTTDETLALNPYDNYALQDVINAKNKLYENKDECELVCLSMGAMSGKDVLVKCLAYGADKAVLLSDKRFSGADTVSTSYAICKAFEKNGIPSLIVCGQKAIDGETGQVVYGISKRMGIQCIVGVKKIVELTDEYVILNVSDKEYEKEIKVKLPAVIAYDDFTIHQPSFSLLKLKQAGRKTIEILDCDSICADEEKCGIKGAKTKVVDLAQNTTRKPGKKVFINNIDNIDPVIDLISKYSMKG